MSDIARCQICGEPMPAGETMFKFHGYSGPCPKPPIGLVELTPDLMSKIGETLKTRNADIAARYPALVDACPYETKLAVAAWVFAAIDAHLKEPGSFRYLIYDRLGFTPDAYLPLYNAGGMNISNACHDLKQGNAESTP